MALARPEHVRHDIEDTCDSLEDTVRDRHTYRTSAQAMATAGTNNANGTEKPGMALERLEHVRHEGTEHLGETANVSPSRVKIVISRTTIGLGLIGVLLICTILCVLTGFIVYHVISPKIPDNGDQPSQGLDKENTNTAVRLEQIEDDLQILKRKNNNSGLGVETGGWELIFRATAGNGYNVYEAWTTGASTTDIKPTSMTRGTSRHYRKASQVNDWINVHTVKYSLFENSREVAYIVFNGTGSSNMDWFDKDRVLDSSWSTVTSRTGVFNYFSIIGDVSFSKWRKFFVNAMYGGCGGDMGYTVVVDTNGRMHCSVDNDYFKPQFLYSKINSADVWDRKMYGRAEYMAIFYKTL